MVDVVDLAQERDERMREAALAAFRPRPLGASAEVCAACDAPIAEARRMAVKTNHCTWCASQIEKGR